MPIMGDGTQQRLDSAGAAPTLDPAPRSLPRVAFLIRDLHFGGAQRQLIELATGMHRAGWPVRVFVMYGGGVNEPDLRARGVPITILGKSGRWDVVGFWYRMMRAIRRHRPAVLHSYLGTENVLAVTMRPFLRGAKIVWGVRSSDMDYRRYGRLPGLIFRVELALARFVHLIICNSSAGREFHVGLGFPADRSVVVSNGIDSDRYHPDGEARAAVRAEWGVAEDELLVGVVARLDPKKDHAGFLRAAAVVAAREPRARFICIGGGAAAYQAELAALGDQLGLARLIWAGARSDMPRAYNALDLLVSSSSWGEGFPNVVAEAMASGVPAVVTAAGDSTLVVGDTGWVCRAQDADDLARAMGEALADPVALRGRGIEARRRIVTEFSIDRLVRNTGDVMLELLHERS
jgi:glycosyltransferase involved in cell wall biosynthesis